MIKNIKNLIRNSILSFIFLIFGIGALIVRYGVFPLQKIFIKNGENEKIKYLETLQKTWIFIIWLLTVTKIIEVNADIEKLKNIKNKIIVSTHPSFIDIVILISIIPHSTCFVADKLAKNPFFRGMVDLLFILEGSENWENKACKMLDDGINIIIFPMGSRHKRGEKPKIRRGASLLALKSQTDITVLNIKTSSDFLQSGQPFYQAGCEPVKYDITQQGEINIKEFTEKYPDEVTFKTEVSKEIAQRIYD